MGEVAGTKAVTWSRLEVLSGAIVFCCIGLVAGVFVQKYYPIGPLLRALGVMHKESLRTSPARIEVPLTILPARRVMVALAFGQSNAANSGPTRRTARERVYNYYQGKLYRAQDPLLGADGDGGSVWTRLGDRLIEEKFYDAIVFVPLAVGNTAIARWKSDGDLHPRVLDAIDELRRKQLTITHLLWHQGESDADLGTSGAEYKMMFLDMLSSIRRRGVIAPIYVSVATKCLRDCVDPVIQQAQQELVDRGKGIFPGPDTDTISLAYRYDRCHFSDDGLERVADLWLQALKR